MNDLSHIPAASILNNIKKEGNKITQNEGKIFENSIKSSTPPTCWIYQLRDDASSFAGGKNTRFASSNICDYLAYDDISRTLYLWELKSTKGASVPISMIRHTQIDGLLEASKHNLVAGLIVNYRNKNNDTFFILIDDFVDMINSINKKMPSASQLPCPSILRGWSCFLPCFAS